MQSMESNLQRTRENALPDINNDFPGLAGNQSRLVPVTAFTDGPWLILVRATCMRPV